MQRSIICNSNVREGCQLHQTENQMYCVQVAPPRIPRSCHWRLQQLFLCVIYFFFIFEVKDYDMIGKDDICGHVVKQISKFAKTEEMTSYELLLVPQVMPIFVFLCVFALMVPMSTCGIF